MRSVLLFANLIFFFTGFSQSVIDHLDLLGKDPSEIDLTLYLGAEIDTVLSATWRYQARKEGVMVQAHPVPDGKRSVITTITFYFTKDGYRPYQGQLIHGIDAKRSWKKNRATLYHKAGFKDLEVMLDPSLGAELRYRFSYKELKIYVSGLYLNDEKGLVNKQMYSLQFSILKWE